MASLHFRFIPMRTISLGLLCGVRLRVGSTFSFEVVRFLNDLEKNGMAQYRRIGVTQNNDVAIVSFNDKKILDEASIQELGAELFGLVEQQKMGDILLNFTNVEFLSSAALGKLITLDRKVKASKGRMKMCNIRPEIFEVFQITKLNKVFDIRKDETEAMTAFG